MNYFHELDEANVKRQAEWQGNEEIDLAFRGLEACNEAGEAAGAIKKLIRYDKGIMGNAIGVTRQSLLQNVSDEIGDTIISLSLIANELGLDTGRCVEHKFNKTSKKHGLKTRM